MSSRLLFCLAAAALVPVGACDTDADLDPPVAESAPAATAVAHGETATPARWRALAATADRVVVGRVALVHSYRTTTEHGFEVIASDVSLAVDDVVSGAGGASATFTVLGGEVDGLRLDVSHTPRFELGQRYVVMLAPSPSGGFGVVGGELGGLAVDDAGVVPAFDLDVDTLAAPVRR